MYGDEEKLELTDSFSTTERVKKLVDEEKKRLWKEEGRKLSRAKIVANIVIKELCKD